MPAVKTSTKKVFKGRSVQSVKTKMAMLREAKKRKADTTTCAISEVQSVVADYHEDAPVSADLLADNRPMPDAFPGLSASATKLGRFRSDRPNEENVRQQRSWMLVECGQLNDLLSEIRCPACEGGVLTVTIDRGLPMGFAQEMYLTCSSCDYCRTNYSSPRVNDYNERRNVAFEINKQMVVYTHEIGMGYCALQKFSTLLGMPVINKKSFQRLDKQINESIRSICYMTLRECAEKVKAVYSQVFPLGIRNNADEEPMDDPEWDVDDGVPWVDVSFDGTWMKRGYSSHHGVGVVIDVMTGYVLDYEVLTTYCHICEMNKEKLEGMTEEEQEIWRQTHADSCQINHIGSAKAMEREAAVHIWRRSVELHNLRYRTMLGDGDSIAFSAVLEDQPYGPNRLITKLECVNHCHKRMGTALRKRAKEAKLGGRGVGRLTNEKCTRLQHYYRGAVLNNLHDRDAMNQAIWATLFHCTSTDKDPHHRRCPTGADSWCFFNAAIARGEQPPPHADHVGTPISREVVQAIVPVYRRLSCPSLLRKIVHGKTQNNNESLHNLIWLHCPKEVFVGVDRLSAAVAEAVSKFSQGNHHIAHLLDFMNIPTNNITVAHLEAMDRLRVQKADNASSAAVIRQRRANRVCRQLQNAQREDAEGPVYGAGVDAI